MLPLGFHLFRLYLLRAFVDSTIPPLPFDNESRVNGPRFQMRILQRFLE